MYNLLNYSVFSNRIVLNSNGHGPDYMENIGIVIVLHTHTHMHTHTCKNNLYITLYMVGAKINFAFHFVQMNTKCLNRSFHFRLFSIHSYRFITFYSSKMNGLDQHYHNNFTGMCQFLCVTFKSDLLQRNM